MRRARMKTIVKKNKEEYAKKGSNHKIGKKKNDKKTSKFPRSVHKEFNGYASHFAQIFILIDCDAFNSSTVI